MSLRVESVYRSSSLSSVLLTPQDVYYEEILKKIKAHLITLFNPFVFREALTVLSQLSTSPLISLQNAKQAYENLPLTTAELIQQLNGCFAKQNSVERERVQQCLAELVQSAEKEYAENSSFTLWRELEFLLKIPEFTKLENVDFLKIKRLIEREDVEELREFVRSLLGEALEDIEIQLASTEYQNLNTLLGEIIIQRPKKGGELDLHWNSSPVFFEGKILSIIDPIDDQVYEGVITRAIKTVSSWIFQFRGNREIEISSQYKVRIKERSEQPFWTAFSQIQNSVEAFEVIGRSVQLGFHPSCYRLGAAKDYKAKKFEESYKEIELLQGQTGEKRYLVKAYYKNDFQDVYRVEFWAWNGEKKAYNNDKKTGLKPHELNIIYKIVNTRDFSINGININNYEKYISIDNQKNYEKIQLQKLKEIQEESDKIRNEFLKPENQGTLDLLLEDFLKHQLKALSFSLFKAKFPVLAARINHLSDRYLHDLNIEQSEEDILKKIVLEANYASLIDQQQNPLIARTMELLKDADGHVREMKAKDVIFFMGNTGAGKSSVVSYFLGIPLENFTNHVGDRVVRVKIQTGYKPLPRHPKIGQSLGESETLYTQGYELGHSLVIGDCPGFEDTRGQEYELCTNFSIDTAVKNVAQIKSLVLTIPVQAFIADRANGVAHLIETIRERFPLTFDPDHPEHSSKVFVLITKAQQAQPSTVSAIADGTRFTELFNEGRSRLEKLFKKAQETGREVDIQEVENIKKRNGLWQSLVRMQSNGQVDIVDIQNLRSRVRLLEKYKSKGNIDKRQYVLAMQGQDMQAKFGKCVHLSASTWTHSIFKPYLEIVEQLKAHSKQNKELLKKKRSLAIIIRTQGQTVRLLREFAGQVVGRHNPKQNADSAVTACQEFIEIYDQNIEQIEKQCDEDLTA